MMVSNIFPVLLLSPLVENSCQLWDSNILEVNIKKFTATYKQRLFTNLYSQTDGDGISLTLDESALLYGFQNSESR